MTPSRSHLVPTPTVDKNGVATTRLKKPDSGARASSTKIPTVKKVASKRSKLTRNQTIQVERSISSFEHMPDKRFNDRTPGDYAFIANNQEIFSVLGVTEAGNAFALLERGARSAEEAREMLLEMDAEDLLLDQSALMQDLFDRDIDSVEAASLLPLIPEEWEDSEFLADAIEFSSFSQFDNKEGVHAVRRYILSGQIKLSDIKTIGIRGLARENNLHVMTDALIKLGSGESARSTEDTAAFLDRAVNDGIVRDGLRNGLALLEHKGMKAVDKLGDLGSFTVLYKESTDPTPAEAVDRAYHHALLAEALVREGEPRSGRYWAQEFPNDAKVLRDEGVDIDEAARHMGNGLTALQTVGVMKGIGVSVSDGWL